MDETDDLKSITGEMIQTVNDFKYLGAWMISSAQDIKTRKAQAWTACHKLKSIWKSTLHKQFKIRLFVSTVESVLLYGSETWTLTKQLENQLNGTYTRMLRMATNVTWRDHMTNEELYGSLPKISDKICERRLRIAGHCVRHPEEIASKLVLWQPRHGTTRRGRKTTTYLNVLKKDTGLEDTNDLQTAMMDRDIWKGFIKSVRAGARPK